MHSKISFEYFRTIFEFPLHLRLLRPQPLGDGPDLRRCHCRDSHDKVLLIVVVHVYGPSLRLSDALAATAEGAALEEATFFTTLPFLERVERGAVFTGKGSSAAMVGRTLG